MATSTTTYPQATESYASQTDVFRKSEIVVSPLNGENKQISKTESVESSVTVVENLNAKNSLKSKIKPSETIVLSTVQNIYGGKIEVTTPDEDNIAIITKSPSTRRSKINRLVYAKLHRNSHTKSAVDKLKGKYENIGKQTNDKLSTPQNTHSENFRKSNCDNERKINETAEVKCFNCSDSLGIEKPSDSSEVNKKIEAKTDSTNNEDKHPVVENPERAASQTADHITQLQNNLTVKLRRETVEQLKNKYSPASFGYPRTFSSRIPRKVELSKEVTEAPVPKPRLSLTKDKEEADGTSDKETKRQYPTDASPVVTVEGTKSQENGVEKQEENSVLEIEAVESATFQADTKAEESDLPKEELSTVHSEPQKISLEEHNQTFPIVETIEEKEKLQEIKTQENISKLPVVESVIVKTIQPETPSKVYASTSTLNSNYHFETNPTANGVEQKDFPELDLDSIEFADPEDKHFIVRKSSSEDSVQQVATFLSEIVMDEKPKEKKRSSSFRRILTGGFFSGKDKKKNKKPEGVIFDNTQNETSSFVRHTPQRHTVGGSCPTRDKKGASNAQREPPFTNRSYSSCRDENDCANKEVEQRFAQMHINKFNDIKNTFSRYDQKTNHSKQSIEEYVPMDNSNGFPTTYSNTSRVNKYIDTSSSSSTLESDKQHNTYENSLIAQAEMRQARHNENLRRANSFRGGVSSFQSRQQQQNNNSNNSFASNSGNRCTYSNSLERFSETPPRAQDTYQNLQLVKPKALIPISSERPLPNPYHNDSEDSVEYRHKNDDYHVKTIDRNLNTNHHKEHPNKSANVRPYFEETYGTVFDSIEPSASSRNNSPITPPGRRSETLRNPSPQGRRVSSPASNSSSPRSPSLEGSKLRLPPNRERIELQPRIKSPIPQAKVSTDKIIATELLRTARSPTPTRKSQNSRHSPSHQKLEIQIDYPDQISKSDTSKNSSDETKIYSYEEQNSFRQSPAFHSTPKANELPGSVKSKPPVSPKKPTLEQCLEAAEWQKKQKEIDQFPNVPVQHPQQLVTSAMIHADTNRVLPPPASPKQAVRASPTLNRMLYVNGERPVTPVNHRLSSSSVKLSPEKQEIRQHVEAFCWKELKKLKERQEMELYYYQLQTYGYADDTALARRSRSLTPNPSRGGRRSLSLPREIRPMKSQQQPVYINNERLRQQQQSIPERRTLLAPVRTEQQYGQFQQHFIRNTPERRTIGPIGISGQHRSPYENYYPSEGSLQRPIFNRGSLSNQEFMDNQGQTLKKVSFYNQASNYTAEGWPTKNGYTQSPPQRRLEKREPSVSDDVFLPSASIERKSDSMQRNNQELYANGPVNRPNQNYASQNQMINGRNQEAVYARKPEGPYGYISNENIYGVRTPNQGYPPRPVSEQAYGKSVARQVTVSSKYCDIYGQIHETADPQQKYGVIQKSGVVYGQLLHNPNINGGSPVTLRHPQPNFIGGSRLTASANDMYKRYNNTADPRYRSDTVFDPIYEAQAYKCRAAYRNDGAQRMAAPNRPLPPVPNERRSSLASRRPRAMPIPSDTESDTSELRRPVQSAVQYRMNRAGK